ncbi:MAG: TonB-dependent receptor [Gemmatimonadota bacterium]
MLSADSGDIKWDVIPVDQVERLEVVKGAGSALYGTGALGGVINVITRSPAARPRTRVRLLSGLLSQPAYAAWQWRDDPMYLVGADVSHSRRWRGVGLAAAAGHRRTTGYEENGDSRQYNAYVKSTAAVGERTTWTGLASWSLDDHGTFLQWRSRTEPLRVPPGDATAHTTSWKLALHTVVDRVVSPATAVQAKGFYFLTDVRNSRAAGGFSTVGHKVGAEVQVDEGIREGLRAVAGATAILDAVRSPDDFAGSRQAVNLATFGQVVARVSARAEAALGLRYDLHERCGGGVAGTGPCAGAGSARSRREGQLSPQLGLSWQAAAGTHLRASAGRGFRAPSITEAFAQASASGVLVCPNPNLTSEKSWSWEVGARQWLGPRMMVDAALFWSEYQDLVEARPEPDPADAVPRASFRNLSEARIRGLEVEHRASLPGRLRWEASYTFLDAVEHLRPDEPLPLYGSQDLVPGQNAPLPYRARHQVALDLSGPAGPVEAGVTFQYASRFERVSGLFPEGDRDFLPVYLVDARASRALGAVQVQARIDNLLQYHYVLTERELRPPRRLSLSLLGTL